MTVGGMLCCNLLSVSRVPSWCGFSLLSQALLLSNLLLGSSPETVHTSISDLFVLLLALHIYTHDWTGDYLQGAAVASFTVRLICTCSSIRGLNDIFSLSISICAIYFVSVNFLRWIKSCEATDVNMAVLGLLELVVWAGFFSTTWLTPAALCTLGAALGVKLCGLGLCPPETLLVCGFVQQVSAYLWRTLLLSAGGRTSGGGGDALVSGRTVLAVSGVGVLCIVLLGRYLLPPPFHLCQVNKRLRLTT